MRVSQYLFAAAFVELGDAVCLDVFFVFESELFLDDVLDRQPVAIPPPDTRHAIPAHRPIARYDILDDRSDDVPIVWEPGGKGRAVVEDEIALRSGAID